MTVSFIPETAPFNAEQRAWLNGFFAGLLNVGAGESTNVRVDATNPLAALALGSSAAIDAPSISTGERSAESTNAAEETFPWHDESLPIVERMKLAEGKPIERRLMAAMAQLDCGSCGYLCKTYGEAIASGEETNLTLCSPGGKETKQMIKQLLKESDSTRNGSKTINGSHVPPPNTSSLAMLAPSNPSGNEAAPATVGFSTSSNSGSSGNKDTSSFINAELTGSLVRVVGTGLKRGSASLEKAGTNGHHASPYSRKNPFTARLLDSKPLNGPGSAKDTRHVVIDLKGSWLTYHVGDALGVFPINCDHLSRSIVERLAADPKTLVATPLGNQKSLMMALQEDCCLKDPTDELLELLIGRISDVDAKDQLKKMLDEGTPKGIDVLDVLEIGRGATVSATEFIETLSPLNPRLYSIASSMKKVGDQVHLTVGKVFYERQGRLRKGVASTMLAERLPQGAALRVFTQANHGGFTVPESPNTPIIMVGPGTGIAPFIAFLQEREATSAPGKNWLFFGNQKQACDYLYRDELQRYCDNRVLTHLDTAFSRDGHQKVYVQDRMREKAAQLWRWLEEGAHFYVCGDASRMAADVDRALQTIVATEGKMSTEAAKAYVSQMAQTKRYVRDVY